MLRSLSIRDIVLIDALDLDFHAGLNVLTGETGAGKSILLDAVGLALGQRGRVDLVRHGAAQGSVTAVFATPEDSPANAALRDAGLEGDDELVIRRILTADGRSRAFINDQRTSLEMLRTLGATLVEVHGQHDDRGLLDAGGHRSLLDSYAGCEAERAAVTGAWRQWREAEATLAAAMEAAELAARDEDYLRHAMAELEALAPIEGEDAELDSRRRQMQAAERLGSELTAAAHALGGDGAEGTLGDALRRLDKAAPDAEGLLDQTLDALSRTLTELGEAQAALDAAIETMAYDPATLEATEERLFALRAAARKHRVDPDALPALAASLAERLAVLDRGEAELRALRHAVSAAEDAHRVAAAALSEARRKAATNLDAAMAAELPPLRLERARFQTMITADTPGSEGCDAVAFAVATNPGAPAGPIGKIASGGELSRFLLALKVCLAARSDGLTMIFDEIDRGVGGATADAVGKRLARLAEGAQVLVVTHSPQVAARGAHHWRITKDIAGDTTITQVVPLTPSERRHEIARMLSGESITEAARSAAEALLAG